LRYLPLVLLACSSSTSESAPTDSGVVDVATTETSTTSERTLANCTTSIAADAPALFKKFKCVTVTTTTTDVIIETEDLPPHKSYYYGKGHPNYEEFDLTRGTEYGPNPNKIAAQKIKITIPREPKPRGLTITSDMVDGLAMTSANEYALGPAGVALDSVALFNAVAAPGMNIEDEKFTFDSYNAHPEMRGAYHYHSASRGPADIDANIIGIMCDGTVVLGCKEVDGSNPAGTLDGQGGHTHDVLDMKARYHAHVCSTGRKYTPEIQYYSTCNR
jgi:hypothetical protein